MGWWGNYLYGNGKNGRITMQQVREHIEKDTGFTVKQVKFGHAIAVYDEKAMERDNNPRKDLLNYILIVLWNYSQQQIMIKTVGEESGPCHYNVPMKYLNAHCKASEGSKYATEWREACLKQHADRKAKLKEAKTLRTGDKVMVYGKTYTYKGKFNRSRHLITLGLKEYSVTSNQISNILKDSK